MTDVVRHVGISRSGLEKALRENYIRPPMEELRHVCFLMAKQMLAETDEKVITIARPTGHQKPRNLSRVFRHQLDLTPKQSHARQKLITAQRPTQLLGPNHCGSSPWSVSSPLSTQLRLNDATCIPACMPSSLPSKIKKTRPSLAVPGRPAARQE